MLRGECLAFGAGQLPYAPIAGALRVLARDLGPDGFDEVAGAARGELARLLPELSAPGPRGGEQAADMTAIGEPLAQSRLFGLLRGLLDRLAAEAPVVLAIEDLHSAVGDSGRASRARSAPGAARRGGPSRARRRCRRLRLPPCPAAGGGLRRPAPRERTALHLALAEALPADPSLADGTAGTAAGLSRAGVVARAADDTQLAGAHPRAVALGRQAVELEDAGGDVVRCALGGDVLREAAGLARRLRASRLETEIKGLARRARIALEGDEAVPVPDGERPELATLGLTDRERAVLELVAEGWTNRQIGAALFMAEKTASVHVSRIFAKLGVKSRVEAATTAHRLGLTVAAADRSAPSGGGRG